MLMFFSLVLLHKRAICEGELYFLRIEKEKADIAGIFPNIGVETAEQGIIIGLAALTI